MKSAAYLCERLPFEHFKRDHKMQLQYAKARKLRKSEKLLNVKHHEKVYKSPTVHTTCSILQCSKADKANKQRLITLVNKGSIYLQHVAFAP